MARFIARRLAITLPLLLLVSTLVFFAFQLVPGDPARMYVGQFATQATLERVREALGLDDPVVEQYARYMNGIVHGDLGISTATRSPVIHRLVPSLVSTLKLAAVSILLATMGGVALGVLAAAKHGTALDYLSSVIVLVGISTPLFWLGLLMIYFFSAYLGWLPTAGADSWKNYIMPAVCLATFSFANIARITRSSVLEVLNEDFIRTARAKGASETRVLLLHGLRNALLPVITIIGLRFGYMVAGAVVVEQIFAWPGLGRLMLTAVQQRDIPVVQASLVTFATVFLLVNLMVDVLHALLDPRIQRGRTR